MELQETDSDCSAKYLYQRENRRTPTWGRTNRLRRYSFSRDPARPAPNPRPFALAQHKSFNTAPNRNTLVNNPL